MLHVILATRVVLVTREASCAVLMTVSVLVCERRGYAAQDLAGKLDVPKEALSKREPVKFKKPGRWMPSKAKSDADGISALWHAASLSWYYFITQKKKKETDRQVAGYFFSAEEALVHAKRHGNLRKPKPQAATVGAARPYVGVIPLGGKEKRRKAGG